MKITLDFPDELVREAKLRDLVTELPRRCAVPACLFDTPVWLAALFTSHPAHPRAQQPL